MDNLNKMDKLFFENPANAHLFNHVLPPAEKPPQNSTESPIEQSPVRTSTKKRKLCDVDKNEVSPDFIHESRQFSSTRTETVELRLKMGIIVHQYVTQSRLRWDRIGRSPSDLASGGGG